MVDSCRKQIAAVTVALALRTVTSVWEWYRRHRGSLYLSSSLYVGDAGNTSLVDAGTPLARPRSLPQGVLVIYFGSAASWRPCNVVWPHQGYGEPSAQCNVVTLGTTEVMFWCHVSDGSGEWRLVGQGLHHTSFYMHHTSLTAPAHLLFAFIGHSRSNALVSCQ